jgi:hypothetical protein
MGVFAAVIPFLAIYLFWVAFFAIIADTLGADESEADGYPGLTKTLGFFFNSFENSIGNISSPSIGFLKKGHKETLLNAICAYLIYFFWFLAQIVLLMVLLNFVIALISQYYEDVMNSAEMHTYVMRQQLNHEYYVYQQFLAMIGLGSERNIDAILLIDGEYSENKSEW